MTEEIKDVTSQHNWDVDAWMAGTGIPLAPFRFSENEITYNQTEVNGFSCTLHGALTALSSLTGYEFTLGERQKLWDKAVKEGANPNRGWITSRAIDLVRHYWNDNRDKKIISVVEELCSKTFYEMINKGYTFVIGGRISTGYWQDAFDDGDLDFETWSGRNYGHIFCITSYKDKLAIIENYKGKTHNIVYITAKQLESLKMKPGETRDEYYFPSAYAFMLKDEAKPSIWAKEAWTAYQKYWDHPEPQAEVTAEQVSWFLYKTGIFTKAQPLTQERLAVLAQRFFNK